MVKLAGFRRRSPACVRSLASFTSFGEFVGWAKTRSAVPTIRSNAAWPCVLRVMVGTAQRAPLPTLQNQITSDRKTRPASTRRGRIRIDHPERRPDQIVDEIHF